MKQGILVNDDTLHLPWMAVVSPISDGPVMGPLLYPQRVRDAVGHDPANLVTLKPLQALDDTMQVRDEFATTQWPPLCRRPSAIAVCQKGTHGVVQASTECV